jgi:hypothetical protein
MDCALNGCFSLVCLGDLLQVFVRCCFGERLFDDRLWTVQHVTWKIAEHMGRVTSASTEISRDKVVVRIEYGRHVDVHRVIYDCPT